MLPTKKVGKRENWIKYITKLKTSIRKKRKTSIRLGNISLSLCYSHQCTLFPILSALSWDRVESNKMKLTRENSKVPLFYNPTAMLFIFLQLTFSWDCAHNSNYKENTIQNPNFFKMYPHFQPLAKIITYKFLVLQLLSSCSAFLVVFLISVNSITSWLKPTWVQSGRICYLRSPRGNTRAE